MATKKKAASRKSSAKAKPTVSTSSDVFLEEPPARDRAHHAGTSVMTDINGKEYEVQRYSAPDDATALQLADALGTPLAEDTEAAKEAESQGRVVCTVQHGETTLFVVKEQRPQNTRGAQQDGEVTFTDGNAEAYSVPHYVVPDDRVAERLAERFGQLVAVEDADGQAAARERRVLFSVLHGGRACVVVKS